MEIGLRELIAEAPGEEFRGVYIEGAVAPTRANVLAPGAIGIYAGGSIYNPAQVLRDESVSSSTIKINKKLQDVKDKTFVELPIEELAELIELSMPDQSQSEKVWNPAAVSGSIRKFAKLHQQKTGYLYVDRERGLEATRRETQGILDSGEASQVPEDKCTLFMLRTSVGKHKNESWWPQIRFPKGRYAFAFAV